MTLSNGSVYAYEHILLRSTKVALELKHSNFLESRQSEVRRLPGTLTHFGPQRIYIPLGQE